MGLNQEQRHTCKLCNKSFLSGKVLGGHMRCHITKKKAKKEVKIEPINEMDMDTEGSERVGYGLRENPKKSWKFSGSIHESSEQEKGSLCTVCGKGFNSLRALFGHMRHHSGKRKKEVRCNECGKEFESLRSLTTHMRSHSERSKACEDESINIASQKLFADSQYNGEVSRSVRRKRSRRSTYKITPNSSLSNLSVSSNVTESEQEIEEAATCLLIMSRAYHNWDEFSFTPESLDKNSEIFEVQSPNQSQQIADSDVSFKSNRAKLEKLKWRISEFKYASDEKILSKSSECDSGLACDETKMVEMEVNIGMLCRGVTNKLPKLDDESAGKAELDQAFLGAKLRNLV